MSLKYLLFVKQDIKDNKWPTFIVLSEEYLLVLYLILNHSLELREPRCSGFRLFDILHVLHSESLRLRMQKQFECKRVIFCFSFVGACCPDILQQPAK